ncbi:MAG: MFS transporter [Marinifilaceae bacterium]
MTEQIYKLQSSMRDSATMRWTALILLSSMMFFSYMFIDVLSPLQSMLDTKLAWSPEVYGTFASSEYFLNVFAFFLIFAGIILDKMGVRFTAGLSACVMLVGAVIKYYAISDAFVGSAIESSLNSFLPSFPASAKLACLGFAVFGCGVEMAGVTVSKGIVKWFKGKELALAMGIEMGIARLGVFAVFRLSPRIAGDLNIATPVLFCVGLLLIGLLAAAIYFIMDNKLEKQLGENGEEAEEPFKISDIAKLFTSRTFLIVAGLCVLYYSAIFPFQKFAANMLECRLGITSKEASDIFSWFPIGAMALTPLLGFFLDNKGKGATMLIIGSVLLCSCHLVFALVPAEAFTPFVAYSAIIVLGISFSLVPAALWPSVPKLVENRYLGSAYSVIFWIQNIGLMAFPMLIGWSLSVTNQGITNPLEYNYTVPMLIFAMLGVAAFFLGIWLKIEDKRKGYGLELPNISKETIEEKVVENA